MLKAKISIYRILNYFFVKYWVYVIPFLLLSVASTLFYRSLEDDFIVLSGGILLLLMSINLLVAFRYILTHSVVLVINENTIQLDALLNQNNIKNLPKDTITITFDEIESFTLNPVSTDTIFGIGSSGEAAPDIWNIVILKLKGNEGYVYINTVFISEKNQNKLLEILNNKFTNQQNSTVIKT